MKLTLLSVILSLALAPMLERPASAQVTRHWNGEEWLFTDWTEFDGQVVTVEGFAWPSQQKAMPDDQIVFPNGSIFIENAGFKKAGLKGKLVRVNGVFETRHATKAPKGAAGFSSDFDYFVITPISIETIKVISDGLLLPAKSNWVFIGMKTSTAKKMVLDCHATEYKIATRKPTDGSKVSSFKMPDGNVLCFTSLGGELKSMHEIVVNDPAKKSDDEWRKIRGYEMPKNGSLDNH